jgi:hypothetical protein
MRGGGRPRNRIRHSQLEILGSGQRHVEEVPDDAIITEPNRFGRPRVPISALFEGTDAAEPSRSLLAPVSDRRSFRLAHAFAAIKDNTCRVSLVNLVEKIAASVPPSKRRRS